MSYNQGYPIEDKLEKITKPNSQSTQRWGMEMNTNLIKKTDSKQKKY